MVKVSKIGVWDVDGQLIREAKEAEKATREIIVRELMQESTSPPPGKDEAWWFANNWDKIEAAVQKAMAGT